jgi:hypothetical protein
MRWKRVGLLVPVWGILLLVAVAELRGLPIGKVVKREIIAALKDPLNLLAERSPGGRGPGVLLSIKGPHERVLSTVRERESPLGIPPGAYNPVFNLIPEAFTQVPSALPGFLPQNQVIGSPSFAPFFMPGGAPTPISSTPQSLPNPGAIVVPEPAPWTIMVLGFLAIGVAARRRVRRQQTADLTCVR